MTNIGSATKQDIKKYPRLYRQAVMKKFSSYIFSESGRLVGTPKKLLNEFESYTDINLIEHDKKLLKQIENLRGAIKKGTFKEIKDMFLFGLIERFVWNHIPEEISSILIKRDLHELGNRLYEWHKADHIIESDPKGYWAVGDENDFEFDREKELSVYRVVDADINSQRDTGSYLIIKDMEDEPFDIAILFFDPPPVRLFVGIYLKNIRSIFLKDLTTRFPCTITVQGCPGNANYCFSTNYNGLETGQESRLVKHGGTLGFEKEESASLVKYAEKIYKQMNAAFCIVNEQ